MSHSKFFLDLHHSGELCRFANEPLAWSAFHGIKCECTLYNGDEAIAEKYYMPVHGAEGDEFILEEHIIEEAEYEVLV